MKKARKAKLIETGSSERKSEKAIGEELYRLTEYAQSKGWSAEELLRRELKKREEGWRKAERMKEKSVQAPAAKSRK